MSEYSIPGQASSSVPTPKIFTPYIPPPKSFQPFTPTIPNQQPSSLSSSSTLLKTTENKNEQNKDSKQMKFQNPTTTYQYGNAPKIENNGLKTFPNFIENRNAMMKGSMMASENQGIVRNIKVESSQEALSNSQGEGYGGGVRKPFRVGQNTEMKFSTMQFSSDGVKIPSFLNDKNKQKKSVYFSSPERPQSSKQMVNVRAQGTESLANSYGNLKKVNSSTQPKQVQKKDVTTEWKNSSSFHKKKQRVFTLNDFQKIKQLGSGKYGKVYLVYDKQTNFICALKILQKQLIREEEITEQLIRELKIQSFLNHTNLIKMYGFFQDKLFIYLIMEAATGGQLFKQLKKHSTMPQQKVAHIMRQICNAINQLHSNHIIHRDIKPENIVLHDNVIKLCDFGWSVYCDSNLRTTFCGTPLYVGPQILKGKQYDEKIDIWSLGVMMYQMLVGQNPFKISRQQDLIKIIKDQIKIPNYVQISKQASDFLYACLQKNPQKRSSIRELINHDFFKKYPDKSDKKLA